MTFINKILIVLLLLTMVGSVVFFIYEQHRLNQQLSAVNQAMTQQKTLLDNIERSQTFYVTKDDLQNFANQSGLSSQELSEIKKDLESLNSQMSSINDIQANSIGQSQTGVASTSVTSDPGVSNTTTVSCNGQQIPCPNIDPNGYLSSTQRLNLNEKFTNNLEVPIGYVAFDGSKNRPWSMNIVPRKYNVVNVLGMDQNGKQYVYNKFTINANGKEYQIPVNSAKFEQELPQASFSWWNPRLFFGADFGVNVSEVPVKGDAIPNISLGIMSYGKTKTNPDLSILQVGVGYNTETNKLNVDVSPIQYNIGQDIPLIKNTYVGPFIGSDASGNISAGLGLKVGL